MDTTTSVVSAVGYAEAAAQACDPVGSTSLRRLRRVLFASCTEAEEEAEKRFQRVPAIAAHCCRPPDLHHIAGEAFVGDALPRRAPAI